MNTDLMFSSKTDQWATPQAFFDQLDAEFHFTLDPCADSQNAKCDRYFTEEQDGLSQDWGTETVFCNPPYGRTETGRWVAKCAEAASKGATVVMLIPARTDTKWFHQHIYKKADVRFIKGRLKFGDSKDAAPFPSMVVVFHSPTATDRLEGFLNELSTLSQKYNLHIGGCGCCGSPWVSEAGSGGWDDLGYDYALKKYTVKRDG